MVRYGWNGTVQNQTKPNSSLTHLTQQKIHRLYRLSFQLSYSSRTSELYHSRVICFIWMDLARPFAWESVKAFTVRQLTLLDYRNIMSPHQGDSDLAIYMEMVCSKVPLPLDTPSASASILKPMGTWTWSTFWTFDTVMDSLTSLFNWALGILCLSEMANFFFV